MNSLELNKRESKKRGILEHSGIFGYHVPIMKMPISKSKSTDALVFGKNSSFIV